MKTTVSNRDLQEVAACLSTVPHPIEDIAADAGITVDAAEKAIEMLRDKGISITKHNAINLNSAHSVDRINRLCANWKP